MKLLILGNFLDLWVFLGFSDFGVLLSVPTFSGLNLAFWIFSGILGFYVILPF